MPFEVPKRNIEEDRTLIAGGASRPFEERKTQLETRDYGSRRLPSSKRTLDEMIVDFSSENRQISLKGQGGEHVVLEFNAPELEEEEEKKKEKEEEEEEEKEKIPKKRAVYKVNAYSSLFKYTQQHDEDPNKERYYDVNDPEKRKKMAGLLEKEVKKRREQIRILRDFFGFHAVPAEQSMVRGIPMTPELYNKLLPDNAPRVEKTPPLIPAMVTMQRLLELDPKKTVDVTGYYAEAPASRGGTRREQHTARYMRGHDLLVKGSWPEKDPFVSGEDEYRAQIRDVLELYPRLAILIEKQEKDKAFREQLRNVARACVKYAEDPTRPILDLVGKKNLVLKQQEDGTWKPLLLDVLFLDDTYTVASLEKIAQSLQQNEKIKNEKDRSRASNILHFIRFVNALALITDIRERINIPDAIKNISAKKWKEELDAFWPIESVPTKEKSILQKPATPEQQAMTRVAAE